MKHDNNNTTDVLIVGAGPTGLMMACQLSLFKIRFRIIDMKKSPFMHSGAMVIHARTMELFSQLGLASQVLQQGRRVQYLSVFFNGQKTDSLPIGNIGEGISLYPSMLLLEQHKTEQMLIDFLSAKGIKIEWETVLTDLVQDAGHVEAGIQAPGGDRSTVKAAWLVGADGGQSTVRSMLNVPFPGKTHQMNLSIMECTADIDLKENEAGFSFSGRATTGFFSLPDGKWRIDAALNRFHRKNILISFKDVQQYFGYDTGMKTVIRHPQFFSVFRSHGRVAQFYDFGRCFLAGDAAHLFTPVGGQGMNTGLQDAQNLGWKLALVVKGQVAPEILLTYGSERRPVAKKTADASDRFFKLAASSGLLYRLLRKFLLPPAIKLLFKMMKRKPVNEYIFKQVSGTGIVYPDNVLNRMMPEKENFPGPHAGERLPVFSYHGRNKTAWLPDLVDGKTFLLIIMPGHGNARDLERLAGKYKQQLSVEVIRLSEDTKELYMAMGIKSQGWFLVRPDQYIAYRSDEVRPEPLQLYLQEIFVLQ